LPTNNIGLSIAAAAAASSNGKFFVTQVETGVLKNEALL
jgi:hypothetical protein